jgi:hypothetical protein
VPPVFAVAVTREVLVLPRCTGRHVAGPPQVVRHRLLLPGSLNEDASPQRNIGKPARVYPVLSSGVPRYDYGLGAGGMIFKTLSRDEYERLPLEQRMDYLRRLMEDIAQKMEDGRRQLEETQKRLKPE